MSLSSSAHRPLSLIARRDLVARQHIYQGRTWWVLKDPLALTYFRFADEEYALLSMLDGQLSAAEIKQRFEARFAPQKIDLAEILRFARTLHESNLVVSQASGQGEELRKREAKQKWRKRISSAGNLLSIQLRGFNPDRLLTALEPLARPALHPLGVFLTLLLWLSALALIFVRWDGFLAKLPGFHEFFTLENSFWLVMIIGVTKVLHEFGHGVACKRYGGECHEMGVMFLVFAPCLYCNVSDSWLLPNKWKRIAIAAAGMYVELTLAAVATWLWWASAPGLFHNLCLQVMLVSSVSTVVFNGNPLMRYDGYYIFSDLLEVPNLRQRSGEILKRWAATWCLGLDMRADPFQPQRHAVLFALYTLAAAVYRWVVTYAILIFLCQWLAPYRLEVFGYMLALMSIMALVVTPLVRMGQFLYIPGRLDQVKGVHVALTAAVIAVAVGLFVCLPLPDRVFATLELRPRAAVSVYADVEGILEEVLVRPGDQVKSGDVLARLRNLKLESELAELESQLDVARAKLDHIAGRGRYGSKELRSQVPQIEEAVSALEEQVAKKQEDLARLSLVAPADGVVFPPPETARRPHDDEREQAQLDAWHGTPLERRNLGCRLTPGALFCLIGRPGAFQANVVIDQADIELVQPEQRVDLLIEPLPFDTITSRIDEVARVDLQATSKQLSSKSGGALATRTDAAGRERPLSMAYEARAPLDDPSGLLRQGHRGQARIHVPPSTAASRVWRWAARTFHFEL